jgi:alpha/beta hydrolase fold
MAPDVLYSNVGKACAAAGFVGVVMSYRLAPKVQHPEQVRDVASEFFYAHIHYVVKLAAPSLTTICNAARAGAIAWTLNNISQYGGKPDDLVVAGHSAGAHLAALCLANPKWLQEAGLDDTAMNSIRGFIGMSGVCKFIYCCISVVLTYCSKQVAASCASSQR